VRNYARHVPDGRGMISYYRPNPGAYACHVTTGEVRVLGIQLNETNTEAWKQSLSKRTGWERAETIRQAGRLADRDKALPTLLAILRNPEEESRSRMAAIGPILGIGTDEALSAVIDALTDEDDEVKVEAARALYALRRGAGSFPASALGHLAKVAHSDDIQGARSAIGCLIKHGGVEAKPLIQDIVDDPVSPQRYSAVLTLAEAGDTSMVPILRSYLRHDAPAAEQIRVVQYLSALGDTQGRTLYLGTIDTAQWLAKGGEISQREPFRKEIQEARKLLIDIRNYAPDEQLVPFIEEFSGCYGEWLRDDTCKTLEEIGSERSVPFLIAMLPEADKAPEGDGWDPEMAPVVHALKQITGEDFGDRRDDWQSWWDTHRQEAETQDPRGK